jgi:protoporphyrinogen oxidase
VTRSATVGAGRLPGAAPPRRPGRNGRPPKVGVIGGGILGIGIALRLAQAGVRVSVLERGPSPGGLAAAMDFGGHRVDRFYHVITPSDVRMLALAEELGLGGDVRFSPVGAGFFIDGELHDLNGIADFLRFRPLTPVQRLRLAWFVALCQLRRNYGGLDDVPLDRWLRRHCGRAVWDQIWKPLLDSRFDGDPGGLPATYLWARTKRMSKARTGAGQGEQMGCIAGGHQRLIDAMADRAMELGVELRCNVPVSRLAHEDGIVKGVEVEDERIPFDLTIATVQPPALRHLLPSELLPLLDPYPRRYQGVVCVLLKVRRQLLPYYAVNVCEPTSITTAVEASQAVGTDHTDGLRLVYLPKYCGPDAAEMSEPDESLYRRFTAQLRVMAPSFSDDDVVDWTVQRARIVEPVHPLGAGRRIPPVFPGVPGLALASNFQVYPWLLNGESVVRFAELVAHEVGARVGVADA